jgi:hypothetical protein
MKLPRFVNLFLDTPDGELDARLRSRNPEKDLSTVDAIGRRIESRKLVHLDPPITKGVPGAESIESFWNPYFSNHLSRRLGHS